MTIQHPSDTATGFAIIPNWMARDPEISHVAIAVYVCIASHTGRTGAWELSHAQIAAETGASASTVKRALADLRALGVLDWETPRQQPGEPPRGCRYVLTTPQPPVHGWPTPQVTHDLPPRSPMTYKEEPQEEPKRSRRKPETSIPEGWEPNTTAHIKAQQLGLQIGPEVESFVNHAQQVDRRCRDWDAAFRNWLAKANPDSPAQRRARMASVPRHLQVEGW